MSQFKPQLTVITEETRREYAMSFGTKTPYKTIQYKTYKELKKNLKKHLTENLENPLSVTRSRRGEWGEFYEHWTLGINGEPKIIKQGWN